jgi:hypothetical protein
VVAKSQNRSVGFRSHFVAQNASYSGLANKRVAAKMTLPEAPPGPVRAMWNLITHRCEFS